MPQQYDPLPFEIDHVIALKHGGESSADNLALACFHCNSHKGPNIAGQDAVLQATVPLFHPRQETWRDHFNWSGALLLGKTSMGRATIQVLEINLAHRVAHRAELMLEGVFAPSAE